MSDDIEPQVQPNSLVVVAHPGETRIRFGWQLRADLGWAYMQKVRLAAPMDPQTGNVTIIKDEDGPYQLNALSRLTLPIDTTPPNPNWKQFVPDFVTSPAQGSITMSLFGTFP